MKITTLSKEDWEQVAYGRVYRGYNRKLVIGMGCTFLLLGLGAWLYPLVKWLGGVVIIAGMLVFLKFYWDVIKLDKTKKKLAQELINEARKVAP